MFKLTAAAVLGLLATSASAQAPANPTQQRVTDNQTAIFHVTVVGRTISAINYRPRNGSTKVDLAGTTLLPEGKGYAEVSGEKGYMKIDAHFDNLQPAPLSSPRGTLRPHGPELESPRSCEGGRPSRASFG